MTSTLKTTLYPFQRDTVERAKQFGGRCLLALEQGLGKSLVAATFIMETESFPAVVVCPASLKFNWANEFRIHYGRDVVVLSGTKPEKFGYIPDAKNQIFVINYDILYAWLPYFLSIGVKTLVLDEAQMTKSLTSRRTKACAQLSYESEYFLALSGTPMGGSPMELYPILNMILKGRIVNRWRFMDRYTKWYRGKFGIMISGAKNQEELNQYLTNNCMVRYRVKDVLPDLPPFRRQTTILEMTPTQRAEYEKLQEDFDEWLGKQYPDRRVPRNPDSAMMAKLGYMKRQVAEWKIPAIIETIQNFLSGEDGKLIVFGIHQKILNAIWDEFSPKNKQKSPLIVRIDGQTPQPAREQAVNSFRNNPDTRLFLGQIVAAGVGLTLVESNHTLFTELDFVPVTHTQAEARNRRIGTTASFVHYNYLIMRNTIEERVCDKLFERQSAIDTIIDGEQVGNSSSFDIVTDLVQDHLSRIMEVQK